MAETPGRSPATGAEMAVSITRAVTHQRIGIRLAFERDALNHDHLARAVRLSLDAEPSLGCSFAVAGGKAFWSRIPDLDNARCFSAVESVDPEADMDSFHAEEIPDAGPQAAVAMFSAGDADHVGIKLSHVLADGQAAKQYAYLLADIYSQISSIPSFEPAPNLTVRPAGKNIWSRLTPEQRRDAKRAKSWANPTWSVPAGGSSGLGLTYRTAYIEPDLFKRVKDYGRARGATINDMMLVAVFRACAGLFDPPVGKPLSLMCTADLRRYLPDAEQLPISQLSISGSLDIERAKDESFDRTLERVRERMGVWAKQCYGAGPFANAEKLTSLGYGATKALLGMTFRMAGGSGKTYPWFTNIGVLDESRLSFAGAVPTSGHMFGPAAIGPSVVPVVSTYRDRMAICMGFCVEDMEESDIMAVLRGTVDELEAASA